MKTSFSVPDMHCQHCATAITTCLMDLSGVEGVVVNLDEKTVEVEHAQGVAREAMVKAIEEEEFTVA